MLGLIKFRWMGIRPYHWLMKWYIIPIYLYNHPKCIKSPLFRKKNRKNKKKHGNPRNETKLETEHVSFNIRSLDLAVNTGSNLRSMDGRMVRSGPGSMGVESQEGSLYMTEERWQKIRIATEPWWLEWPMIWPRRELNWEKSTTGFFLIIT